MMSKGDKETSVLTSGVEDFCRKGRIDRKGWKRVRLGEVSSLHNGYAFQSSKYCNDGNYYVITIANVQDGEMVLTNDTNRVKVLPSDMQAHQKLKKGDLLISLTGNVGRICVVDRENCLLNQRVGLLSITHSELINTEFLFYCLQTRRFQIQMINAGKGGAQPNIGKMDVLDFSFDYPSYKEQCVIASSIRSINKHISTLKSLISKYEAIKKSTVNLLLNTASQYGITILGTICKISRGIRVVRSQLSKGQYLVYQNSLKSLGQYDKWNAPAETTFIIAAGSAGEIGYCPNAFWAADDCFFLTSNERVISKYLYYALTFRQQYILSLVRRGSVPRLPRDVIEKLELPIPPLDEQKRIVAILDSIDETIRNLKSQLAKTLNIKEGMMTYFFG